MKKVSPVNFAAFIGITLVVIFLFYYLKKVDISLIYSWQQSIPLSFGESLLIPGGLSTLLADLILEFTTIPVLGSIIISLLMIVVFFSLKRIFRRNFSNPLMPAFLIAALIPFVISLAHYRLPFDLFTSLFMGLFLGMLYSYCTPGKFWMKLLCSFITAIIVFMLAGIIGLLILLQVMVLQVLLSRKYRALISVLPVLLIPLLYLPFNLTLSFKQLLLGPLLVSQYDEIPLVFYFALFSPLLLHLGFSIGNFFLSKFPLKATFLFSGSSLIIVLAVLVYFSLTSINEIEKKGYSIFEAGYAKDWDKVLEISKDTRYINQVLQFEINRALYGSGRLLDEMFTYPQQFAEEGIFLEGISSSPVSVHTAAFYYDLGFANEARHWATEAQMVLVRHPVVLKLLVISYLAIGREEAAEKYLRVLSGSRLHRDWCDHVRVMIDSKQLGEDPEIRFFRMNNPEIDFFAGTRNPHQKLLLFYRSNPNNNVAFEFLVASYLLQHKLGGLVTLLPQFKKQGHETFPKAVEEALMIYVSKSGGNSSVLSDYAISKTTVEEFRDFNKLIANADSKAERMRKVSKYKDSYWFYILFSSPYAKK